MAARGLRKLIDCTESQYRHVLQPALKKWHIESFNYMHEDFDRIYVYSTDLCCARTILMSLDLRRRSEHAA